MDTSLWSEVRSIALSAAIGKGASVAAQKAATGVGVGFIALAISSAIELEIYSIKYATYNSVKNAYSQYCDNTNYGLLATNKYVHNTVTGTGSIVTVFARWSNSTVNSKRYSMTGTWKNKVYYAGGERIG